MSGGKQYIAVLVGSTPSPQPMAEFPEFEYTLTTSMLSVFALWLPCRRRPNEAAPNVR